MKTKTLALLVLVTPLFFCGCQNKDPGVQADNLREITEVTFTSTVEALTDLRLAGSLSDSDWADTKKIIVDINDALDFVYDDPNDFTAIFQMDYETRRLIIKLREYLKKEEEDGQ